jgi:drug/metabolite transporter (DMT)-like permease
MELVEGLPLHLLLPLLAALLYVVGVMLAKRSADLGVGVWRTAFVSNLVAALAFQPLLGLGGTWQPLARWWQPAVVAVFFILGQTFTFVSLTRGDVSVATPVLGVKIILVALFTTLLRAGGVGGRLWVAAALSTLAIALLNFQGGGRHHRVGSTIVAAVMAAASFALFDVLVQKWAPPWGVGRFLPVMLWFVVLLAFGFVPLFRAPLRDIRREAWPWLLGGCGFIALQSVIFVSCLAKFGNATAANVIYSSRGLWSIVAVWLVGHWFHNAEQHLPPRVLLGRLAGAVLMFTAIALVLT